MKHQWMAYAIVALLSVGAGVAIAGLPNNVPVDATIVAPPSTEAPEPTTAPDTTAPNTTAPNTTAPNTTAPNTTAPNTTTQGTTAPTTTEPDVTESTDPDAVPDRADIIVAVANGAGVAGTAARNVERLAALGYENITRHDGAEIVELTVIYYADGFEGAAARMAEEYELLPNFTAPLADAPTVIDLPENTELLAYIGIDRAN